MSSRLKHKHWFKSKFGFQLELKFVSFFFFKSMALTPLHQVLWTLALEGRTNLLYRTQQWCQMKRQTKYPPELLDVDFCCLKIGLQPMMSPVKDKSSADGDDTSFLVLLSLLVPNFNKQIMSSALSEYLQWLSKWVLTQLMRRQIFSWTQNCYRPVTFPNP